MWHHINRYCFIKVQDYRLLITFSQKQKNILQECLQKLLLLNNWSKVQVSVLCWLIVNNSTSYQDIYNIFVNRIHAYLSGKWYYPHLYRSRIKIQNKLHRPSISHFLALVILHNLNIMRWFPFYLRHYARSWLSNTAVIPLHMFSTS